MENGIQPTNDLGTTFTKPKDTGVPKDRKWYHDYALYVASKYNFIIPRFNSIPLRPDEIAERWATRVMLAEAYVKAEHDDKLFGFMGNDELNNPLPTKFIKDPTPFTIYKHIWGNIRKNCISLPDTVYANAIHNEALAEKELSINMAKMKIDHAESFKEMEGAGAQFKPMGGMEFNSAQEVDDYADNMQDAVANFFTAAMKDFLYSQNWEEKCSKMAEYVIPAYFCRVELQPKKSDIEWTVYRPAQCIWDNTFDDELGRRERFQGVVDNLSVPALLAVKEYNWTEEEIKDIQNLASQIPDNTQDIVLLNNLDGITNITWWALKGRVPTVGVVKAKWISWDEENDCETWYQCDLIGNKYVKNAKRCDNITYNKDGSMNPPFCDFIPEMTYGTNSSIIFKMREISGLITGINAKINALIARAKGKVPVFFSNKVPKGTTQGQLLKMVASGLVFIKGAEIDDIMNNQDNKNIADVMDLTAAVQDIMTMRNEIEYWENKMREMASTPLVQLGTQTEVIGARVQDQTLAQSTLGMLPLYHGFMLYMNHILNVAAQMKKNMITVAEDKEKYALQVSPRQYKYFEVTKDFCLADLQIYLSQQDAIDEAEKQHIRDIAERQSQIPNTWFDALDAAMMMTFSTKTELVNYMQHRKKVWEEKQARLAAEQQAMAAEQQAANNATQENIAETNAEASLANTAMKGQQNMKEMAMQAVLDDGKETPE